MNPWISHVKHYAKQHNISYKEALKKAKSSYRPVKGGSLKSANDWYWQKIEIYLIIHMVRCLQWL